MRNHRWLKLLAYVTGSVNQDLLLRNEYLAAENQILRARLPKLRLTTPERITLSEIAKRLGRKTLTDIATVAKPDTILAWYRNLIARKYDGSANRAHPGRPPTPPTTEALVIRMARENSSWGYDRISGALSNLGLKLSGQSIANILRRHGIAPAPKRGQLTTWKDFLAAHANVLAACDFFTIELLTWRGLVTHYVLFFIHLETRRITIAGITRHPDEQWMHQIARSATQEAWGYLTRCRYLLHDRDAKFFPTFRATLRSAGVHPLALPPRSPNLNAYAERWIRSVKQECLSKLILTTPRALWRVLNEYNTHYHQERNHQGKNNRLLFPQPSPRGQTLSCRHRLGGILKYYERAA
jgi:hypothetical protein